MKSLFWIFLCLAIFYSSTTTAKPNIEETYIKIDGIEYKLNLKISDIIGRIEFYIDNKKTELHTDSKLYQGSINGIDNSWIAISAINDKWSGLASAYNKLYEIDGKTFNSVIGKYGQLNINGVLLAEELAFLEDYDINHICPLDHSNYEKSSTAVSQILPSPEYIANDSPLFAVQGINTAANVALAIDEFCTARYGNNNAVARALSLLNSADAIYRKDLGIALKNIALRAYTQSNKLPINNKNDKNAFSLINDVLINQNDVFKSSEKTLGALITCRDLSVAGAGNAVAGVAYIATTCELINGQNGAISISEDLRSQGFAAVILAHEIGHNFGARHDPGSTSCPTSKFIMSPFLNPQALPTEFSSCSRTDIANHISTGNCYKTPIDMKITLEDIEPSINKNVTQGQTSTRSYNVTNSANAAIKNIPITAVLKNNDNSNVVNAVYTDISLNGTSCKIATNRQNYTCVIPTIKAGATLILNEIITTTGIGEFKTTVEYKNNNSGPYSDINTQNNRIEVIVNIVPDTPPEAPTNVTASSKANGDIEVKWKDNSSNEEGFKIERTVANTINSTVVIASNLPPNTTIFLDTNTNLGTQYLYLVSASNSKGTTAAANVTTATSTAASSSDSSGGGGGAFYIFMIIMMMLIRIKSPKQERITINKFFPRLP